MLFKQKLTQKIYTKIENGFLKFPKLNYSSENIKTKQKDLMARGLPKQKPIEGVKDIILVSSGKGGVGKSTTAVNLSTALKLVYPEKQVGLLDSDIFGPTIPLMMNLHETPFLTKRNLMEPLVNYGVKWHITFSKQNKVFLECNINCRDKSDAFKKSRVPTSMSFGFLIEEGSPVIWRGLMVMQALEKLMRQVEWEDIDYLIIDTPPGTGDTHLSLIQNLPISGVLLVTTPQTAALQVTKRGALMYKKLNIPIIGLVENMSTMICPSCSNKIKIFGDGTLALSREINAEILESFPLNGSISDGGDKGIPIVLHENNRESLLYKNLARQVATFLENHKGKKAVN